MLVEFSVSNFRSIKDKQTLSLATKKAEHAIQTNFPRVPFLLKKVSLMGPNASGKSNIIKAIAYARHFIYTSHRNDLDEKINHDPYLLHKDYSTQPSEFEFVFLLEDTLYQYGFSANATEIFDEWLFVTKKGGNTQKWILRGANEEKDSWYISPHLRGRRKEWIHETRPNTLILSILGTQKNVEVPKHLLTFFKKMSVFDMTENLPSIYTEVASHEESEVKQNVITFLRNADLGITDLRLEKNEFTEEYIHNLKIPDHIKNDMLKNAIGASTINSFAVHLTEENEKIEFNFEEHESCGTKMLYSLAFPIIDALAKGKTLIVDELDNSMHFKELNHIIELFSYEKTNPKNAQLIFTHHAVTALKKLQKDEIYFVDKINSFSSEIIPLTDYENRDDVPFDKRYMDGMYNALPHIRKEV